MSKYSIALPGSKISAKNIKFSDLMKIISKVEVMTPTANGVSYGLIKDDSIVELLILKDDTFEKGWSDMLIPKSVYTVLAKELNSTVTK